MPIDEEQAVPVTMSPTNPFRGRRMTWSRPYVWLLLWMASLTIPTFQAWRQASSPNRWEYQTATPLDYLVLAVLALATVSLGYGLGRQRRWGALWVATPLGALMLAIGHEVAVNRGWDTGRYDDDVFFYYCVGYSVVLGVLSGAGALAGVASLALRRRLAGKERRAPAA
jgi:hypothetical protein